MNVIEQTKSYYEKPIPYSKVDPLIRLRGENISAILDNPSVESDEGNVALTRMLKLHGYLKDCSCGESAVLPWEKMCPDCHELNPMYNL